MSVECNDKPSMVINVDIYNRNSFASFLDHMKSLRKGELGKVPEIIIITVGSRCSFKTIQSNQLDGFIAALDLIFDMMLSGKTTLDS